MEDWSKIYLNNLRKGDTETLAIEADPDFLGIRENDLKFQDKVQINGMVYLAGDSLVLKFHVRTLAHLPCSICNEPTAVTVIVPEAYHTESLADIQSGTLGVYDIKEVVREAILLEVPNFVECGDGHCPERDNLQARFKELDEGEYRPFQDLSL